MNQIYASVESLVPQPVDLVRPVVATHAWRYPARPVVTSPRPDTLVASDPSSSLVVTWVLDGPAGFTSIRLSATKDGRNGLVGVYDRVAGSSRLRLVLAGLLSDVVLELT